MSFNKETRRSLGPISKNQKFVVQNSRDREGETDRHGSAPGGLLGGFAPGGVLGSGQYTFV